VVLKTVTAMAALFAEGRSAASVQQRRGGISLTPIVEVSQSAAAGIGAVTLLVYFSLHALANVIALRHRDNFARVARDM
jgi:hypothetical protein